MNSYSYTGGRGRPGRLALMLATAGAVLASGTGSAMAEPLPRIVTTFSILEDMARSVAGDLAEVEGLTPIGAEVHEYELAPGDFVALESADLVFFNGYILEQWMGQVEATVPVGTPMVAVAEATGRATIPIEVGDFDGDPDPHLWMDPETAAAYVDVIADALGDLLPEHQDTLRANADDYIARILDAAAETRELLAQIPEAERLLITSEAAFLYFADALDLRHDAIWGSNAEVEGSPSQLRRVIDIIVEERPAAIFFESTVSDRHVQAVSEDTGVPVAGPLYVDSLGVEGSGAETYPDMLRTNAQTIFEALKNR